MGTDLRKSFIWMKNPEILFLRSCTLGNHNGVEYFCLEGLTCDVLVDIEFPSSTPTSNDGFKDMECMQPFIALVTYVKRYSKILVEKVCGGACEDGSGEARVLGGHWRSGEGTGAVGLRVDEGGGLRAGGARGAWGKCTRRAGGGVESRTLLNQLVELPFFPVRL
ncbi:hypothetical protein Tco_0584224 [Tanacetum coccineum]